MKTQISRYTDQPSKRYSGVYQQQGRMIIDADGNELNEIIKRRVRDALRDIIGSGTPDDLGVLRQAADGTWSMHWGRLYADGQAADLTPDPLANPVPTDFDYTQQADFPSPPALPPAGDSYVLYADTWERAVTSVEDGGLLDAAFAGADTASRTQTMAQVKWAPEGTDPSDEDTNPTIGNAELTVVVRAGAGAADPCDPCADELALDADVGSYMFRVEIHDVSENGSGNPVVLLKWSSENGAEQYLHEDKPVGFARADFVYEKCSQGPDHESEKHLGVHLADGFTPTRGELSEGYPASPADEDPIRRWDGYCRLEWDGSAWTLLEVSGDGGGVDRGITLAESGGSDAHGLVSSSSGEVSLNLKTLGITLDLGGKRLVAGDYWLAPVRGAIHQAGDTVTGPKTPDGIKHRYLPLAEVDAAGALTPVDLGVCRPFDFPQLTDLKARDVCYTPDGCDHLTEPMTVQDAITRVCKETDIADHNKHLHGCGVVCGYKVHCAGDGEPGSVKITAGYAVAPDGSVIKTDAEATVPLVKLADDPAAALLDANQTGVVVIYVTDDGGTPTFHVTADFEKPSPYTIWRDFLEHCIAPVLERLKEIFEQYKALYQGLEPGGDPTAVALYNLFAQTDPLNITNTDRVYLSHTEHKLLVKFYEELHDALSSPTNCALGSADALPDYPFDQIPMDAVFTWGAHNKARSFVTESERVNHMVFTFGSENGEIVVLDAQTRKAIGATTPEGFAGLPVRDVAVSADGARLYAVAQRGDDALLSWADIQGHDFVWTNTVNICGHDIRSMIPDPESSHALFAASYGQGVIHLRPESLVGVEEPDVKVMGSQFFACGHIVYDRLSKLVLATRFSKPSPNDTGAHLPYDSVVWMIPDNDTPALGFVMLHEALGQARFGEDGLTDAAFLFDQDGNGASNSGKVGGFYVVAGPLASNDGEEVKVALAFRWDPASSRYTPVQKGGTLVLAPTHIAMEFHFRTAQLLITEQDQRTMLVVKAGQIRNEAGVLPVQIGTQAVAITHGKEELAAVALNYRSNTLTWIDGQFLGKPDFPLNTLASYREEMLNAFRGVADNAIEALRDCFCDLLLPTCTPCAEGDLITLSRVSILNGKVDHICNLSRRKFLVTMPNLRYWLSTVGLFGKVNNWVSKFCCPGDDDWLSKVAKDPLSVVGEWTDAADVPDDKTAAERRKNRVRDRNRPGSKKGEDGKKFGFGRYRGSGKQLLQAATAEAVLPSGDPRGVVEKDRVVDTPLEDAKRVLDERDVKVVGVRDLSSGRAGKATRFVVDPPPLERGAAVTLYTRRGKVAYYEVASGAAPIDPNDFVGEAADAMKRLEARREILRSSIDESNTAVGELQTKKDAIAAELERARADLQGVAAEREAVRVEVEAVRSEIETLRESRASLERRITEADAKLNTLESGRAAIDAGIGQEAEELRQARADMEALATERAALRAQVDAAKSEIQSLETTRESLARGIKEAARELETLESSRATITADIGRETESMRANVRKEMAPYQPVTALEAVDADVAKKLNRQGVHFVGQAAGLSRQQLAEMLGGDTSLATSIRRQATRAME